MTKYEIRTNKKKSAIIKASLELFSKRGFVAVSIKEIAEMANVSQVSIYNYFGSKEALVKECVCESLNGILLQAEELLHTDRLFIEKIEAATTLCYNEINGFISEYFSANVLQDETLKRLLLTEANAMKRIVYEKYIEAGKLEGVIDNSISTAAILDFMDAINSIGFDLKPNEIETKQIEFQKLFLFGIIGK